MRDKESRKSRNCIRLALVERPQPLSVQILNCNDQQRDIQYLWPIISIADFGLCEYAFHRSDRSRSTVTELVLMVRLTVGKIPLSNKYTRVTTDTRSPQIPKPGFRVLCSIWCSSVVMDCVYHPGESVERQSSFNQRKWNGRSSEKFCYYALQFLTAKFCRALSSTWFTRVNDIWVLLLTTEALIVARLSEVMIQPVVLSLIPCCHLIPLLSSASWSAPAAGRMPSLFI